MGDATKDFSPDNDGAVAPARPGPRGITFTYLQVMLYIWLCMTCRVEALASASLSQDCQETMTCLNVLRCFVEEECGTGALESIDEARRYVTDMIQVALGVPVAPSEILDEVVTRVCLSFDTHYYPVLVHAILLSDIPMCVCGRVLLPKVTRWARTLIRCDSNTTSSLPSIFPS